VVVVVVVVVLRADDGRLLSRAETRITGFRLFFYVFVFGDHRRPGPRFSPVAAGSVALAVARVKDNVIASESPLYFIIIWFPLSYAIDDGQPRPPDGIIPVAVVFRLSFPSNRHQKPYRFRARPSVAMIFRTPSASAGQY